MKKIFFSIALLSSFALKSQTIIIPVVYHVLYSNSAQNVHDSILQDQLDVLNEDYNALNTDLWKVPAVWQPIIGNMNVFFTLATIDPAGNPTTGIERQSYTGSVSNWNIPGMGGLAAWPDTSYLNIWVGNLTGPTGLLAAAQFPGGPAASDGMKIDYRVLGKGNYAMAPYNYGRAATHELGHWFGLRHLADWPNCADQDSIADTPTQAGTNVYGGYPVGTILTDSCQLVAPGVMWMNFMQFVNDTSMYFFTQGQVTRMIWVMNNMRMGFLTPDGIDGVGEHERNSSYSVFPSPSAGGLIQVNRMEYNVKTSVEVYDVQGRLILAPSYFENGSTTMQVDLSGFANGTYSFLIRTENAIETKRVVIAK